MAVNACASLARGSHWAFTAETTPRKDLHGVIHYQFREDWRRIRIGCLYQSATVIIFTSAPFESIAYHITIGYRLARLAHTGMPQI